MTCAGFNFPKNNPDKNRCTKVFRIRFPPMTKKIFVGLLFHILYLRL